MAKDTPLPCPVCGAVRKQSCIVGKLGSVVWKRQLPYSPGHRSRWTLNKKVVSDGANG